MNSSGREAASFIMAVLHQAGFPARMVGGAVRDGLLGMAVEEIDLATTATPPEMIQVLQAAGIKTVPTGIEHGTITAVKDGTGVEITTLRRDIETDGRHARVTFTDDWKEDAARRDFTINAMSQDADGVIHDYFGGQEDLRAGRLCFVGDARARLREDYLRLLRLFRFQAYYGKQPLDTAMVEAAREAVPFARDLSRERVWKEFGKILAAPQPLPVLRVMQEIGLLTALLPQAKLDVLEKMLDAEKRISTPVSPLARLAALLAHEKTDAAVLQNRFALSGAATQKLALLLQNPLAESAAPSPHSLATALYRYGIDLTSEFLLLLAASDGEFDWDSVLPVLQKWQPKTFPLTGADILALDVLPGPEVGEILRRVEAWWIEQSFQPDKAACLRKAGEFLSRPA
jgi:poly(A) polymerase